MKKTTILLILAAILTGSCGKQINTRRYYVLELPKTTKQARPEKPLFNVTVDVRDFRVARAFDQTRIALRTNTNELDYYFYHHWASKPSRSVADFVYDHILDKNMFSGHSRDISYNPDYIIHGDVKSLERIQEENMAYAHVEILMEFIDAETAQVYALFEDDQRLPLEPMNSMNTFASATSQILRHVTDEFLKQVSAYLESEEIKDED